MHLKGHGNFSIANGPVVDESSSCHRSSNRAQLCPLLGWALSSSLNFSSNNPPQYFEFLFTFAVWSFQIIHHNILIFCHLCSLKREWDVLVSFASLVWIRKHLVVLVRMVGHLRTEYAGSAILSSRSDPNYSETSKLVLVRYLQNMLSTYEDGD